MHDRREIDEECVDGKITSRTDPSTLRENRTLLEERVHTPPAKTKGKIGRVTLAWVEYPIFDESLWAKYVWIGEHVRVVRARPICQVQGE